MTTVSYSINQFTLCSPIDMEQDYSIHFQNKMSPEEFQGIMQEYKRIFNTFNPMKYSRVLLVAVLLCSFLWFIPVILMINGNFAGFWTFYIVVALIQITLSIALIAARVRISSRRTCEMQHFTQSVNARMVGRGINFRVISGDFGFGGYGYRANRVNGVKIEVEVAQSVTVIQQGVPLTQQGVPAYTAYNVSQYPPQYSTQPYFQNQYPQGYVPNQEYLPNQGYIPPPSYTSTTEGQPLLKPPKEV